MPYDGENGSEDAERGGVTITGSQKLGDFYGGLAGVNQPENT